MNDLYMVPNVSMDDEQALTHVSRPVITPTLVHVDIEDERVQDVITRVKNAILGVYPDADFSTYIGTSPLGIYVEVQTEHNDIGGILQILDSKLGNLHIAAGVDICVLPKQKVKAQAA